MNEYDAAKVKSAALKALGELGTKNGHKCPSKNNIDSYLHMLLVYDIAKKWSEKVYKRELENVIEQFGLESVIHDVPAGNTGALLNGDAYILNLEKKNPATRLDAKELIIQLRKAGVEAEIIAAAIRAATKENAPAKSYTVALN